MTEPVSQALVTQVWQEIASMPTDAAPALIERMQDEQPALLAYLLALEAYDLPQEEFEVILYLGIAIWQMMKRGHPRLMRASIKKIEQAEEENTKTLDFMEEDTEGDFLSATLGPLEAYPEPEVLRYIVEALMEPDPEDVALSDEAVGIAFLHLKTALDALIRCRPK
jgi:hypothetical protein